MCKKPVVIDKCNLCANLARVDTRLGYKCIDCYRYMLEIFESFAKSIGVTDEIHAEAIDMFLDVEFLNIGLDLERDVLYRHHTHEIIKGKICKCKFCERVADVNTKIGDMCGACYGQLYLCCDGFVEDDKFDDLLETMWYNYETMQSNELENKSYKDALKEQENGRK